MNNLKRSWAWTVIPPGLTLKNSTFCRHGVFMCLYGTHNEQRLFPYTTLTFYTPEGSCLLRVTNLIFIYMCTCC